MSTPFAKLTVDTDNFKHPYTAKELKRCASKYPHNLEITALGIRIVKVHAIDVVCKLYIMDF